MIPTELITFFNTHINRLSGLNLVIVLIFIGLIIAFVYITINKKNNQNKNEPDNTSKQNNDGIVQGDRGIVQGDHGIIQGNNGQVNINHKTTIQTDPITNHLELNQEINSKIIDFSLSLKSSLKEQKIDFSNVDKLKNQFLDLLISIDLYVTSIENKNIQRDIVAFYKDDLILIFILSQKLNKFIEDSHSGVSKVSKSYFTSFLPKNESVTETYSEIMRLYNSL